MSNPKHTFGTRHICRPLIDTSCLGCIQDEQRAGASAERAQIIQWLRRPAKHNEDDSGRRRAADELEAMRP